MAAVVETVAPARIGRFELIRELGRGAQGSVHLARDTRLDRNVAVKTLRLDRLDAASQRDQLHTLLAEARIASQLTHANIVTLYDAGEEAGRPYLIFEYVEGQTLAQHLRTVDPLAPAQAVRMATEILRGVAAAHAKQVVHRDLKPANVMLTADGTARIMDFGIARCGAHDAAAGASLAGTPAYMAPEYIGGAPYTPTCDVFSVGMILYEMLTGANPVAGGSVMEIMRRITDERFAPPSACGSAGDERLDAIVLKALAKDPAERYHSAGAMFDALQEWLDPSEAERDERGPTPGTLEFLLRRIRHKSDFPALSSTIAAVNRAVNHENERANALSNNILKDFALTNKLLKLVNAALFAHMGGQVSTVSRAVAILGFDRVRDVALSLILFDHLKDRAQAAELRDEIVAAYLAGVVARGLVAKLGVQDAEEAYICAMFHRLGRMLVIFYLRDEAEAIAKLTEARGDEGRAARTVLGLSYEDLGMGVAESWGLPTEIVASMRPIVQPVTARAQFDADKLRVLASLASGLCDAARVTGEAARGVKLAALVERFGRALGVSARVLSETLAESAHKVAHDAVLLGLPTVKGGVLDTARGIVKEPDPAAGTEPDTVDTIVADTTIVTPAPPAAAPALPPEHRRNLLTAGVQDVTQTLAGDHELNDVLRMILETAYRAMGFKRVLLCIRDPQANALRARFGFGEDIGAVIKAGFLVPLNGPRDVFFAALSQGADVCIEDAESERMQAYVPEWLRTQLRPRGFMLLPILVAKRPVALLYADADASETLKFAPEELALLKTLRNQAVLAIKQRS